MNVIFTPVVVRVGKTLLTRGVFFCFLSNVSQVSFPNFKKKNF